MVNMAAPDSHPSHHRRQTLKIAKLLSKEDVDEIVYLSEDYIPPSEAAHISSGVDLMRCLERHSKLGPGDYGYLLSSLREVGREDLITKLSESLSQPPLQFTPPSFRVPNQMLCMKLSVVQSKQMKYAQQMRYMNILTRSKPHWESEWKSLFDGLIFCMEDVHPLPHVFDMHKVLGHTLEHIFGVVHAQTSALVNFQTAGHHAAATRHLQEANASYQKLYTTLESIEWTKRKAGGVMTQASIAAKACSYLSDFLSELLGKEAVIDETTKLSETLSTIESLIYIAGNAVDMLQWLFVIIHMAIHYSLDLQQYKGQIKSTISLLLNRGITHHTDLLARLLKGTRILERVEGYGLISEVPEENLDASASMIKNCPVLMTLYVNFMILLSLAEGTPADWHQIKVNFVHQEKMFAKMYSHEVKVVFQELCNELDLFLEETIETALQQAPGLQELIKGMFCY